MVLHNQQSCPQLYISRQFQERIKCWLLHNPQQSLSLAGVLEFIVHCMLKEGYTAASLVCKGGVLYLEHVSDWLVGLARFCYFCVIHKTGSGGIQEHVVNAVGTLSLARRKNKKDDPWFCCHGSQARMLGW